MRLSPAVLLAAAVLAPDAATAQGDGYARILFSTTQVYTDNLFAAPASGNRQDDLVSSFGPSVEMGYVSEPLRLVGRYAFNAERYLKHETLNTNMARQDAGIELRHLATRRLALGGTASYVQTHWPGEFNLEGGLVLGRARATRVAASPTVSYEWTPLTRLNLDYEFVRDSVAGGYAAQVHSARLGLDRRTAPRNAQRIDYRVRYVGFGNGVREASHLVTVGWARQITQLTGFDIAVGPRLTEGAILPELSLYLQHQRKQGGLSVGYVRSESALIGQSGSVVLQRAVLAGTTRPTRNLSLSAQAAGLLGSTRRGWRASLYALDFGATRRIARHLSLVAWAHVGFHKTTFAGQGEPIAHRRLSLNLTAPLPGMSREPR